MADMHDLHQFAQVLMHPNTKGAADFLTRFFLGVMGAFPDDQERWQFLRGFPKLAHGFRAGKREKGLLTIAAQVGVPAIRLSLPLRDPIKTLKRHSPCLMLGVLILSQTWPRNVVIWSC
jgi:hypothetical protein